MSTAGLTSVCADSETKREQLFLIDDELGDLATWLFIALHDVAAVSAGGEPAPTG